MACHSFLVLVSFLSLERKLKSHSNDYIMPSAWSNLDFIIPMGAIPTFFLTLTTK